jgi:hypothetical protein
MSTGLYVYDKSRKPVPAKYLEIDGRVILDPKGNPYKVPADFNWNTYMGKFQEFRHSLEERGEAEPSLAGEGSRAMQDTAEAYKFLIDQFHAAWPASPSDIQRTYNGYTGRKEGDFVTDFRPAASFLFGAACAALGLGEVDALLGGGAQNIASWWRDGKVKISLFEFLNNPENVPHIKNGWSVYSYDVARSERSLKKTKAPTHQFGRPAPAPADKPSVPSSPSKPHSSLETPQSPVRAASFPMDTPDGVQLPEPWNKLLSDDPSQEFPMPAADPLAHYAEARSSSPFPSPMEDTTIPTLEDILRPNLLTSPPEMDFFFSGSGNPPQVSTQPSGQSKTISSAPVSQAAQPPFYSAKDQLDFLGRVYRVAKPLSEATGLSLPFILAHAAHEVDFGKSIEGNNLFNLKADKDWEGPTHRRGNETYRSYPSYEASMEDYLAHLQGNPRYAEMFEPDTRENLGMLADAIDHAGYSDDPLYTFRILGAAQDPIMKRAVWQYQHWPPEE